MPCWVVERSAHIGYNGTVEIRTQLIFNHNIFGNRKNIKYPFMSCVNTFLNILLNMFDTLPVCPFARLSIAYCPMFVRCSNARLNIGFASNFMLRKFVLRTYMYMYSKLPSVSVHSQCSDREGQTATETRPKNCVHQN